MLKPNQKVYTKWNSRNRKHYQELGYDFSGWGNEFEVDVKHLTKGSKSKVIVICDYCGKEIVKKYQIKATRKLPTKEQLVDSINFLINGNHKYTEIILDI